MGLKPRPGQPFPMKSIHSQIQIHATAEKVWQVLTDLNAYPQWNPFITSAKGEILTGSRLRIRIAPPGSKAMTFRPIITAVDPGCELRWRGRLLLPGLFDGEHIFKIQPLDGNRILFVQAENFTGLLVPLVWGKLNAGTRQGFELMNTALKRTIEEGV